jgi:dTMP kinase
VLLVDVDTARERMLKRGSTVADRMEQQPLEFYQRVDRAYRELARSEPARFVVIDGAQSIEAVEQAIWSEIAKRFADRIQH